MFVPDVPKKDQTTSTSKEQRHQTPPSQTPNTTQPPNQTPGGVEPRGRSVTWQEFNQLREALERIESQLRVLVKQFTAIDNTNTGDQAGASISWPPEDLRVMTRDDTRTALNVLNQSKILPVCF